MTFTIRDVETRDMAQVHALNEAVVPHVNSLPIEELNRFREVSATFRVAVEDDGLLGFIVTFRPGADYGSENYRWFCDQYDDFIYVDRIAVSESARGRGVARAIYADLESAMTGLVPRITCEVNIRPPNEASRVMHETLGFEEVGQQDTGAGEKRVSLLCKPIG